MNETVCREFPDFYTSSVIDYLCYHISVNNKSWPAVHDRLKEMKKENRRIGCYKKIGCMGKLYLEESVRDFMESGDNIRPIIEFPSSVVMAIDDHGHVSKQKPYNLENPVVLDVRTCNPRNFKMRKLYDVFERLGGGCKNLGYVLVVPSDVYDDFHAMAKLQELESHGGHIAEMYPGFKSDYKKQLSSFTKEGLFRDEKAIKKKKERSFVKAQRRGAKGYRNCHFTDGY